MEYEEYYENANLVLPSLSRWRHFKFRLKNDKWIILKKRIRTVEDLRKKILEFKPLDVYHSVSLWLCPEKVRFNIYNKKMAGYNIAYNLFLGGDLVIDIDGKGRTFEEKIEYAKNEAFKIIDLLKEIGFKKFKTIFTGGKGFRIDVEDFIFDNTKYYNLLPNIKMQMYMHEKKNIIDYLKSKGADFCYDVSLDAKRVVRVIGTINSRTGYVCKEVDLNLFKLDSIEKICLEAPKNSSSPLGTQKGNDGDLFDRICGGRFSKTEGEPNPPIGKCFQAISNKILGTQNRYIPIFIFHNPNFKKLFELTLKEKLGDLYIFRRFLEKQGKYLYYVISLKALEYKHCLKLLKKYKRINELRKMRKYKESYLPLISEFVKIIYSPENDFLASKPHYYFLKSLNYPAYEYKHLCGNKLKILKVEIVGQ